jgi:predicted Rossmann fold nucleotide-binding protein DprA/Smf involved in DNA uptake
MNSQTTAPIFLGNRALLELPKFAFLASRKIAPEAVLRCYDWATARRDAGECVISGFHSPLEKDVLRFLLKGKQPVILVLARRLWRKIPEELATPLSENRLLIISVSTAARAGEHDTEKRNRYILSHAAHIVFGSLAPDGHLAKLAATLTPVRRIIL